MFLKFGPTIDESLNSYFLYCENYTIVNKISYFRIAVEKYPRKSRDVAYIFVNLSYGSLNTQNIGSRFSAHFDKTKFIKLRIFSFKIIKTGQLTKSAITF